MGIFSWFGKSSKTDYETLLASLSTEIDESKTHLSEIRLRERRWALLVYAYGIALWAVWAGLWWVRGLPLGLFGLDPKGVEARAIGGGIVAAGPVFIWALNRALHFVFSRQRRSSETHLRSLLAKQKKHLDEIKKATNYDSTRKLIEQYDESGGSLSTPPHHGVSTHSSNPSTPVRRAPETPTPAQRGQGGTPRAPGHLVGAGGTPAQGPGTPVPIPEGLTPEQAASLHLHMQAIQPVLPTPEKKWYDRVVDSILGDDPSQAAQSKYALVCGECFRHNGLVGSKYEWERMQWICPRCNHMNPPPLQRHHAESSCGSHSTPASAPSQTSPVTPSHLSRASPRPRRQLGIGERGTPKSSRLGQEVFSASTEEEEELNRGAGEGEADIMDVDEEK